MERIVEHYGKPFNYSSALSGGYFGLCNKCDELMDLFEEECKTKAERKAGRTYGAWRIYEP